MFKKIIHFLDVHIFRRRYWHNYFKLLRKEVDFVIIREQIARNDCSFNDYLKEAFNGKNNNKL